jgi:homoserine dehydrogenase
MVKIGLIGCGTIGSGVLHLYKYNKDRLTQTTADIHLDTVCGLSFDGIKPELLEGINTTTDWESVATNSDIDIVIELIGGEEPARTIIETALKNGKSVVTANKLIIAKHGKDLFPSAKDNKVYLHYEAAVGGAVPIIKPLKSTLVPNHYKGIYGIINGTTNYILSKMQQTGARYEDVLKEAQSLGFAEADPSSDVDGFDCQYKIAILAGIAYQKDIPMDEILVEGISRISAEDIDYCKGLGLSIKLVAMARQEDGELEVRVHPVILDSTHPLSNVNGVYNAVYVVGDASDDIMFYGQGAGSIPTASSVWADVLDIVHGTPYSFGKRDPVVLKSKSKIISEYYFRFRVEDIPGVLSTISGIFAKYGISIKSAIQKGLGDDAELVMVSHSVLEENKDKALSEIEKASGVEEVCSVIRVGI